MTSEEIRRQTDSASGRNALPLIDFRRSACAVGDLSYLLGRFLHVAGPPRTELVFALTSQVGTNLEPVGLVLRSYLDKDYGYRVQEIKVSDLLDDLKLTTKIDDSTKFSRYSTRMAAGSEARELFGPDALARLVAFHIAQRRPSPDGKTTAYIVHQLKHPSEVDLLRQIYGPGFFQIGVYASEDHRRERMTKSMRMSASECQTLIDIDLDEAGRKHGQKASSTFERADVFVRCETDTDATDGLQRFMDLVFGDPFTTPTRDEHAMFIAFGASMRSAELGRQVGAAVFSEHGELLSVGTNEVPRSGGGLYWAGDEPDGRDFAALERDSNHSRRNELIKELAAALGLRSDSTAELESITRVLSRITEYGRSVHAELEALLACARVGVSARHGTLMTTTFPCHNCARHVVAAGIRRVVFIEPYPKSLAPDLHEDTLVIAAPGAANAASGKAGATQPVFFEPFVGVGPRRYVDLFSLTNGAGFEVRRKLRSGDRELPDRAHGKNHEAWRRETVPRVPLHRSSYLDREDQAARAGDGRPSVSEMLKTGGS